ncbi:MAG TPA: DEAD/DEAH box helicase [Candidatus Binatia bacterium]|jgi:ATP-dependent RNA helicase RhlE|nr:DEAD/DEAH box helicase [Candidatus Binatia bacterium]
MSPLHNAPPEGGFSGLGIAPKLLEILTLHKYIVPTPIQRDAIPMAIEGKDLIGIAQTGTGKTLAFGVPMLQRLAQVKGRGLVILPTRELALQVDETFMKIGKAINLRTAVLIGGASMYRQNQMLKANPHVIVATPGRLIDHLNQKTVSLENVKVLVLDEADRMLDMGFEPQIRRILSSVPKDRQTMLFSATMPDEIVRIATNYMKLPVRIEIARAGTTADNVTQELFVVRKEDKNRLLEKMLDEHRGSVLVFSRTKFGAKKIMRAVKTMGHTSAELHSNRSLAQRREALDGFKAGRYRVLVATDIAARGIDVTGIAAVINYDVPENPDDYVHRIGRTGRAGLSGHAITFAQPDQGDEVRQIEKVTRIQLPITKLPELPPHRALPPVTRGDMREERRSYGSNRMNAAGRGPRRIVPGQGQARPIARPIARPPESRGPSPERNRPDDILGGAGSDGGVGFFGPHASGDLKKRPARPRDFRRKR